MKRTRGSLAIVGLWMGCFVQAHGATAKVEMKGTAPGSALQGIVDLEDTAGGLKIQARLSNVPPGMHGFHIHDFGSCADLGKAAGGHYNPMNVPHGHILKDGLSHAHAGDMGNITADARGNAQLDVVIPGITLVNSERTVAGRAIILHEKADDFGQPVGNAGGRIGCGPILLIGQ